MSQTAAVPGPETRVLSYHDVFLRQADVDLLTGPDWLNDQLIAFYFTYLLEDMYPGLAKDVCLMPPGTSFLLLNSDPSDAAVIFEALQLHDKQFVIFAVNDNPDVDFPAGGSHWSCLAFHRPSNTFRHYDSSGATGPNRAVARQLAGAATPLVRSKGAATSGSSSSVVVQQPSFVQVSAMPVQENGYDCGLYVCAAAKALCSLADARQRQQQQQQLVEQAASVGCGACSESSTPETAAAAAATPFEQQESHVLKAISSDAVTQLRAHMLSLIQELAAKS